MQMIRAEMCVRAFGMPDTIATSKEACLADLHPVAELVHPRAQQSARLVELLGLRLEYFHLYLFEDYFDNQLG